MLFLILLLYFAQNFEIYFMINIYFDDRIVVLTDKKVIDNNHVSVFKDKKSLAAQLKRFEQSDEERLYIVHTDVGVLFDNVKKCFKYIKAAGGVVFLPDGRVLMIKRLGIWDLPKGKVEKGESFQDAALREVMEECGLEKSPEIIAEITNTFHTYSMDGKKILKKTVWYAMLYEGNEKLNAQFDEDITQAVWLHQNLLNVVMQNTYKSIKQVLLTLKN